MTALSITQAASSILPPPPAASQYLSARRLRGNALPPTRTFPHVGIVGFGVGAVVPVLLLGRCRCRGGLSIPLLNVFARRCDRWPRIAIGRCRVPSTNPSFLYHRLADRTAPADPLSGQRKKDFS